MKETQTRVFLPALLGFSWALCTHVWASNCMVAYWRFDEGDGDTVTDSAGDNDGTIYGAQWAVGKVGGGLYFDGDDYVDVGTGYDLTHLTPDGRTIEAWAMNTTPMSSGSAHDLRTILAQRGGSWGAGYGFSYGYVYRDGGLTGNIIWTGFYGGEEGITEYTILSDEWYHIAGVFEDGIATIYVNGEAQPTFCRPQYCGRGYTYSDATVRLGRSGNSGRLDHHIGILDEVAVYNCALSTEEIWERYQHGLTIEVAIDIKPGSDPNPINPGSMGLVPVAIFSSEDFDATTVDPATVELAGASVAVRGKDRRMAHEEDVNGDGLTDLVVQVETQSFADFGEGGTVELTGTTFFGRVIVGYDEIVIVPPQE